jgi:hypothetical protein
MSKFYKFLLKSSKDNKIRQTAVLCLLFNIHKSFREIDKKSFFIINQLFQKKCMTIKKEKIGSIQKNRNTILGLLYIFFEILKNHK